METRTLFVTIILIQSIYYVVADLPIKVRIVGETPFKNDQIHYRLPNNTKPESYNISITTDIDRDIFDFSGNISIQLTALEETSNITLHARQLTILSASFKSGSEDGQSEKPFILAPPHYDEHTEFLTFQLNEAMKAGDHAVLQIHYAGILRDDQSGFYRSFYTNGSGDRVWLATTQFESTDARHAFPCYDEPALKATFSIRINHGSRYTAISNMPELEKIVAGPQTTTIFQTTPPTSPYLIAFIVSDFAFKQNSNTSSFRHRVFARPNDVELATLGVEEGEQILQALEKYLGIPFTLPKMDQIAIPQFSAGAMENWGLVTYREQSLLFNGSVHTFARKANIVRTIAHEFGHQWFGDLVSPMWWSYLWLNEGFATLFENIGTDLVHPDWNVFQYFLPAKLQNVFQSDATNRSRPMTYYIENPSGIANLFDNIAYAKSGCVLRMFLHALTEKSFKKGLKYYLGNKAFQAAADIHLFESLDRAAKKYKTLPKNLNVTSLFSSWSNQAGFPLLTVKRNYKRNTVTLYQERYFTKYPNAEGKLQSWWIPFNFDTAKVISHENTAPTGWLPQGTQSIKLNAAPNCSSDCWILFNKQQTGYYRVLYDAQNYKLITNELELGNLSKIHPLSRSQIIDDVNDFVKTGRLPYSILFDLQRYLSRETEMGPWRSAKRSLFDIRNALNENSLAYEKYQRFVIKLVEPFYKQNPIRDTQHLPHTENYAHEMATSLACTFGLEMCLNDSTDLLIKSFEMGRSLSPNYSDLIMKFGMRNANSSIVGLVWDYYFMNETNEQDRIDILETFGNIGDKKILQKYLELSLDPNVNLTKYERSYLCSFIGRGSQYGLRRVIDLLKNRFDEVTDRMNVNRILLFMVDSINSREVYDEFNSLFKTIKSNDLTSDSQLQHIDEVLTEKLEYLMRNQQKIENSVLTHFNDEVQMDALYFM